MILIHAQLVDATQNCLFGDSEPCEAFTDDVGRLFRDCQREYGRCRSKVYIDLPSGRVKAIGWVFEKTARYEDTGGAYKQEAWITFHDLPPTRRVNYHHHDIERSAG